MDTILSVLEFLLAVLRPQPIFALREDDIAVIGRLAFGVLICAVVNNIMRQSMGAAALPAMTIGICIALLSVVLWPSEIVVGLVLVYAVCSRLLDGIAAGVLVGSLFDPLKRRFFALAALPIAPELIALGAVVLSWFGVYRMMLRIPVAQDSPVIRAVIATICAAGLLFEPSTARPSMRAAFGTIYALAFVAGFVGLARLRR